MRPNALFKLPSPAMVVAMLALFVVLGGTAFAATKLSKNSVTTKTIKNRAVTSAEDQEEDSILGSNVRSNTLTGTQINESKLGVVPEAAKVTGVDPANLITKSQLVQFSVASNRGDAPKTVATFGPFTLTGRCEVAGANTNAYLDITTSANDTFINGDSDFDIGETEQWINYTNFAPNTRNVHISGAEIFDPSSGLSVLDGDGEFVRHLGSDSPARTAGSSASIPVTRP